VVSDFKQPIPEELAHDFLWRVHPHVPAKGLVAIFNRSHYEDVLVVRVHELVPEKLWSKLRRDKWVRKTNRKAKQHDGPQIFPSHFQGGTARAL
jgi:polyphosphate kinase 2 (PPK2 family)